MDRRTYLKSVALTGTAGLAGLAACSGRDGNPPGQHRVADPNDPLDRAANDSIGDAGTAGGDNVDARPTGDKTDTPRAGDYATTVDVVEAGADPTGTEPVNEILQEHAEDDTLLAFPAGTYLLDPLELTDTSRLGLIGFEGRPTFVPTTGDCYGGLPYVLFEGVEDLLIERMTFDFRETGAGGAVHLFLGGDSALRDLTVLGSCSNQLTKLRIDIRDRQGSAVITSTLENTNDNQSLTGIYVGDDHAGELTFRDCSVDNLSDNGLYASSPGGSGGNNGTVNVVGGTYRNNNIANVRLGTSNARAEDVTVRVDSTVPGWGRSDARGIRLRNKQDQVIENCEVTFTAGAAESTGGIVFHHQNGGALVTNTRIQVDRDGVPAVNALSPSLSPDSPPVFENLTVTGSAAGGRAATVTARDGTVFRDCTIEQPNRGGIHLIDSMGCLIVDSDIETGGVPLELTNAAVRVQNSTVVTPDGRRTIQDERLENETVALSE